MEGEREGTQTQTSSDLPQCSATHSPACLPMTFHKEPLWWLLIICPNFLGLAVFEIDVPLLLPVSSLTIMYKCVAKAIRALPTPLGIYISYACWPDDSQRKVHMTLPGGFLGLLVPSQPVCRYLTSQHTHQWLTEIGKSIPQLPYLFRRLGSTFCSVSHCFPDGLSLLLTAACFSVIPPLLASFPSRSLFLLPCQCCLGSPPHRLLALKSLPQAMQAETSMCCPLSLTPWLGFPAFGMKEQFYSKTFAWSQTSASPLTSNFQVDSKSSHSHALLISCIRML